MIGIILIGIIVFFKIPYSPVRNKFQADIEAKVEEVKGSQEVCTYEEIEKLPAPLQKFCNYIGLENYPKYQVVNAMFHKSDFVFDTKSGKVLSMDYDLWLFFDDIYRTAYCGSSLYGIPFEGIDYVTEDVQGGMKGILAKVIPIFDERVEQGYRAGIISWLAEGAGLNPSVLLSPYITYEEIDDQHVKATVTHKGVSGSGVFTINELGEITEFYSDERQIEEIDGKMMQLGWKCYYSDYQEIDGIKMATKVRSDKIFPDGRELTYFSSDDFDVEHIR